MLRQNTNEVVKVLLKDSMGAPKTGLVAADFSGSNVFLYKNDNTKVTIALTLGANLVEVDSTDSPGVYSIAIPSGNLDQLGSLAISIQPAMTAFVANYLIDSVYDVSLIKTKTDLIGTTSVATQADVNAARDSIKGAQSLDISTIAGGASFSAGTDNLHSIKATLMTLGAGTAAAVWDELLASHMAPNSLGEFMNILNAIAVNRLRIDKISKQLVLYHSDSTTVWKSYPLYDLSGVPATITASERGKAT